MKYPIQQDTISRKLIPAIAPDLSNEDLFLTKWLGKSLVTNVTIGGLTIETAPLRPGTKLDLLGNSNANLLIQKGLMDVSDTIDPVARIKEVYLDVCGDLVVWNVLNEPTAVSVPELVGDTRGIKFDLRADGLSIGCDTRNYFGQHLIIRDWLHQQEGELALTAIVRGHVATSRGTASFSVDHDVRYYEPVVLDPRAVKIIDNNVKVVGFTLDMDYTNTNRR